MATRFLRKIILEELKKVLNEQDASYDPSTQIGMTKRSPLPGEQSFMGPEQATPIPGSGTLVTSSPKSMAIRKLQKKLRDSGFILKVDGVFGKDTAAAFNAAMGEVSKGAEVTPKDMSKFSVSDINGMTTAIGIGDKNELRKLAVKYTLDKAYEPIEKALAPLDPKSALPPAKGGVTPAPGSKRNALKGTIVDVFRDPKTGKMNPLFYNPTEAGPKTFGGDEDELKNEALIRKEIRNLLKKI